MIRSAQREDAAQLVDLMSLLGHEVDVCGTRSRLEVLLAAAIPQLVAAEGEKLLGLCGLHLMTAIHRHEPVGRITILVVREECRGSGVGRALVQAAEVYFRGAGCRLVEVTSNDRLSEAHQFYEHVGYRRTSKRFAKQLI